MTTQTFELVLFIDSNGDYAVGKDDASAKEAYENDIQPVADCGGFRLIKLNLKAALPEEITAEATIPDTDGPLELAIA